eukprot:TRINITY_DN25147_c0_g1_i1.p1 TRINITY_DN25147_c0_g1~~TRINITY_DN25147_c0_g1_i1.p1  ORF type:complete len:363 (+),score=84.85 TRINITY_DN25147_c0_g1_i1:46-1134(+)
MGRNCYDVLGVPHGASTRDIRTAYLRLARQLHPDRHPAAGGGVSVNSEPFQEIQHAYELLSDPFRRCVYDLFCFDVQSHGGSEGPLFWLFVSCCCCCSCFLWTFASLAAVKLAEPPRDSFWSGFTWVPWSVVFAPVWLFDLGMLGIVVLALSPSQFDLVIAFEALSLVTFTVLLYLRVSASAPAWLVVVMPLVLRDVLKWLPRKLTGSTPHRDDADLHAWAARAAYPLFFILLARHLDDGSCSWWVVLAPLYAYVAFCEPSRYRSLATLVFCTSGYVAAAGALSGAASLWLTVPVLAASGACCCCCPEYDVRRDEYSPLDGPINPTGARHATYRTADFTDYGGTADAEQGSTASASAVSHLP